MSRTQEIAREKIEDAVAYAVEAGFSRGDVESEVAYALDLMEEEGEL